MAHLPGPLYLHIDPWIDLWECLGNHRAAGQLVYAIFKHHRSDIGPSLELRLESGTIWERKGDCVADKLDSHLGMDGCCQAA